MPDVNYWLEAGKICASAALGAIATYAVTRQIALRKSVLGVDVTGSKSVGGFAPAIDLKVSYNDRSFDHLKLSAVKVLNLGEETVESIEIVFWDDDPAHTDWYVQAIFSSSPADPKAEIEISKNPYVIVRLDLLCESQSAEFVLISKYKSDFNYVSKTKHVKFLDLRARRNRALEIGSKVLRHIAPLNGIL